MKHHPEKKRKRTRILSNTDGISAIEFALLFPIFLIIALGIIEFGWYFIRNEMANSAVSEVSMSLQRDPNYYNELSPSQMSAALSRYGYGLLNLSANNASTTGNYICVDAYTTAAAAQAAAACTNTHFNTANPAGTTSTAPFYIAVRADLKKGLITPIANVMPSMKNIHIAQTSDIQQMSALTPPVCATGEGLHFDGTSYSCYAIYPPDCSQRWQRLVFSGGAWQCINVPYIITGGVAWPSTKNTTNPVYWAYDYATDNLWHNNISICQQKVTFTIPAGMPAGTILARGNLIYPTGCTDFNCSGSGDWNAWSVSFINVNIPTPPAGGTGYMDVCMGNGGNYATNDATSGQTPDTNQPLIASEHVSWVIVYIPNSTTR